MKIKKFNESNKNWSIEKLKKNIDDGEHLKKLFSKYLFFKHDADIEEELYDVVEFFFDLKGNFIINYFDGDSSQNSYYVVNIDELIKFINNPELSINAKKFNL